jgi:hypothetical protein
MPAVREKLRMAVAHLLRADTRHGFTRTAVGGHTFDGAWVATHENHAIGVPCATHLQAVWKVRERLHGATRHVEAFQLAVGEEPDGSTVGRPELTPPAVCPGERARRFGVELAQPESWAGAIHKALSVRRKGEQRTRVGPDDLEAHLRRLGSTGARKPQPTACTSDRENDQCGP